MTITATVAIACALLLLGRYLNRMATASHAQRVRDLRVRALLEDLEILRLLQQHRGLGAQHEAAAVALRDAVAASLTQRLQQRSAMPDPHAVAADWAQLRDTPADFDGHSRLIDSLIAAIDEREPLGQAAVRWRMWRACEGCACLPRTRAVAHRACKPASCLCADASAVTRTWS